METTGIHPNDPGLLARVVRPYRTHCRYLKSAEVTVAGEPSDGGRASASCLFEIPDSCYIDDTGHFNSVEFNICYNQMLYYIVAKGVKDRLFEPFSRWSLEDYWQRQLADFLITEFRSNFRSAMRGRHFRGEIHLTEIAEWRGSEIRDPLVVLRTACRYWDEYGGDCHGEVTLAITNPPVTVPQSANPLIEEREDSANKHRSETTLVVEARAARSAGGPRPPGVP